MYFMFQGNFKGITEDISCERLMRFTFNIKFIEDKKKLKDKIVFLLFLLQRERERERGERDSTAVRAVLG